MSGPGRVPVVGDGTGKPCPFCENTIDHWGEACPEEERLRAALRAMAAEPGAWSFTASSDAEALAGDVGGQQAAGASGEPVWWIQVIAWGEGDAHVFGIVFPGPVPEGVKLRAALAVTGLEASPFEVETRDGICVRVAGVAAVAGAEGSREGGGAV